MPQKLAIAISGAMSLGSYAAGILYEIIEAIAQHNSHPDTMDEQRIEIDVITGSSTGAITACILTQKLMFEAEALRQPHANALYSPWVEDLDATALLKLRFPNDSPQRSLLSSEHIGEIGYTYLLQRYATGQPTPRQRHPAAAASIRLGLVMSNLKGHSDTLNLTDFPNTSNPGCGSPCFTYTRHSECFSHEITDRDADDHFYLWQRLEKMARAASAFPVVFQPLIEPRGTASDAVYIDGSLFENDPLSLAKQFVNQIDPQHLDHHNRFYLYIAPPADRTTVANTDTDITTAVKLGAVLLNAMLVQAHQHWITISQVNDKIRQFEQQAKELSDVLIKSPQLRTSFSQVADHLLAIFYSQDTAAGQQAQMQADQTRLRQQFAEEYERIVYASNAEPSLGEAVATSWLRLVQVLEKIQDLGDKDVMTVYAMMPEAMMADEALFAWTSLLDPACRDFDYTAGRYRAVHFLTKLQTLHQYGKSEGQLYLTNFVPGHNLKPLAKESGRFEMERLSVAQRHAVKAQLLHRTHQMVEASESRFWIRWLLKLGLGTFMARQLDRWLKLKK